jgi:hypothetical protein
MVNWLYLLVTESVKNGAPAAGWQDPAWLTRLDVVFANLYFDAIESALTGGADGQILAGLV